MRLAVVGSRKLNQMVIDDYLPEGVTEIVSGGASGVNTLAKDYANRKGIKITEFLPKYNLYGRAVPIKRNEEIAQYADEGVALWDGKSRGTQHTINFFKKLGKKVTVIIIE